MTTTIHFSGLNTDPLFLLHLASDSRLQACPQVSLLPCWLNFGQMGLASFDTHPLGNTNQFHPFIGNPKAPSFARHNDEDVREPSDGSIPDDYPMNERSAFVELSYHY